MAGASRPQPNFKHDYRDKSGFERPAQQFEIILKLRIRHAQLFDAFDAVFARTPCVNVYKTTVFVRAHTVFHAHKRVQTCVRTCSNRVQTHAQSVRALQLRSLSSY